MKHKIKRRYFKIIEIKMLREWAEDGKSQAYTAQILNRNPGVICRVAKLHNIKFNAKNGRPKIIDKEKYLKRRAEACKRYRRNLGIQPRIFKSKIQRFDDPRIMI